MNLVLGVPARPQRPRYEAAGTIIRAGVVVTISGCAVWFMLEE